eukprot:m.200626 g.200626  ORF g.200626 m.200626 type:complete len:81 (-) comp25946_c1_seq6:1304-1546(-)
MLWKHNLETRQTVQLTRATVDCPDMKMNDFISSKIYIKCIPNTCNAIIKILCYLWFMDVMEKIWNQNFEPNTFRYSDVAG